MTGGKERNHLVLPTGRVVQHADVVGDLVEGEKQEAHVHALHNRPQARHGSTYAHAHETILCTHPDATLAGFDCYNRPGFARHGRSRSPTSCTGYRPNIIHITRRVSLEKEYTRNPSKEQQAISAFDWNGDWGKQYCCTEIESASQSISSH